MFPSPGNDWFKQRDFLTKSRKVLVQKSGFLNDLVSKHSGVVEKRLVCHTRCPRFAPQSFQSSPSRKNAVKRGRKMKVKLIIPVFTILLWKCKNDYFPKNDLDGSTSYLLIYCIS
jgi:hypothetical protein